MADMKGITCCGDCIYYDWKKKRCKRGASQDPDPKRPFFADCPLPSVEPERPKGRWETDFADDDDGNRVYQHYHRDCGYEFRNYLEDGGNFCPNCGADMRGESDA